MALNTPTLQYVSLVACIVKSIQLKRYAIQESLSLYPAIDGLIGGIMSTAAMTLSEIPSWKRWGLHGVFEWHENQILTMRLLHLSDAKRKKNHFKGVFFFHFLNGSLAGIVFPYIIIPYTFYQHSLVFVTWISIWSRTVDSYSCAYT